ncbi:unnamed protein product [Penicillium roqueforti FM164]|uniref:Genomic scaffold, ProqFM164S02 n=1 Tax=Penicillium roqueforti (strain FM164) TaxID=1365484 RepID=W6QBY1_PENRF|nr:unnamed protein product [Penicillium roqueforti FM164]
MTCFVLSLSTPGAKDSLLSTDLPLSASSCAADLSRDAQQEPIERAGGIAHGFRLQAATIHLTRIFNMFWSGIKRLWLVMGAGMTERAAYYTSVELQLKEHRT